MKVKVLFLGLYGHCRCQMAEGFARKWAPPDWQITNAGLEVRSMDPQAEVVMNDLGIDSSRQPCQTLADIDLTSLDLVISLTDQAAQRCPVLPGAPALIRWEISPPPPKSILGELATSSVSWTKMLVSIYQFGMASFTSNSTGAPTPPRPG